MDFMALARVRGGVGGLHVGFSAVARELFVLGTTLPRGVLVTLLAGAPFVCFQAERCSVESSRSPSGRLDDKIIVTSDLIIFSGQNRAAAGSMGAAEGM